MNAYLVASNAGGKLTMSLVHSGNSRGAIMKFLFNIHVHALNRECKKVMKKGNVTVYEVFAKEPFQIYIKKINIKDDFVLFDDFNDVIKLAKEE